jgi:hypothetical protein
MKATLHDSFKVTIRTTKLQLTIIIIKIMMTGESRGTAAPPDDNRYVCGDWGNDDWQEKADVLSTKTPTRTALELNSDSVL